MLIVNLLRGSTRRENFSLQQITREPPLADGCARPRVGKPDAVKNSGPPLRKWGPVVLSARPRRKVRSIYLGTRRAPTLYFRLRARMTSTAATPLPPPS